MREAVTAFLGIAIVLFTLALTGLAFSMAGEGPRMQDAITVLTLLFGLAGVVVGYYFGRVPAEARAVEAQARANEASQTSTGIINQAAGLHDKMQDGMDKAGLTLSTLQNLTKDSVTSDQLEQIKEIIMLAQTGISSMTKTLPSSARSN